MRTKKLTPVEYVIHRFGGVRATAEAIGRTPGAISKWRKKDRKGAIPGPAQQLILSAADLRGIDIDAFDLILGHPAGRRR